MLLHPLPQNADETTWWACEGCLAEVCPQVKYCRACVSKFEERDGWLFSGEQLRAVGL